MNFHYCNPFQHMLSELSSLIYNRTFLKKITVGRFIVCLSVTLYAGYIVVHVNDSFCKWFVRSNYFSFINAD